MDQEDRAMGSDGKPLYTNAEENIRYDMLVWFYKDLCEMALIAMRDPCMQSEGFAVVCIESCDRWEDLVDSLMAQGYRTPRDIRITPMRTPTRIPDLSARD